MTVNKSRHMPFRRSFFAVLVYLVAGLLWIKFSDQLAALWFPDPQQLSLVQTWKGFLFVLVTGLVLFFTLYRQFNLDRELLQLQDRQQRQIRELNEFRESVIENANIWISVLDGSGRIVVWNRVAELVSGYSSDEVLDRDDVWHRLYPDEDYRHRVFSEGRAIIARGEELVGYETTIINRQGERRLMSWNTRSFYEGKKPAGAIMIGQDITDIRQAQKQLAESERQLATLMSNLPGMAYRCLYDPHWTMKFVSVGSVDLVGYQPDELLENRVTSFADLIHPEDSDAVLHAVESAIGSAEPYSVEYRVKRRDGTQIWVWERGRAVEEANGLLLEGIILDISEQKALEAELSEMATRDVLTGLFNRRETARLLDEEVARAERYRRSLSVLWIDLDRFKSVNDRFGHAAGDQVLQCVSALLTDSVRSVDTVGRFGGEEFVVILPEMGLQDAEEIAERLRLKASDTVCPIDNGEDIDITISVGVVVYPQHGSNSAELCLVADQAMYRAKRAGRNRIETGAGDTETQ
jgi:diguanylate cyclase (GGDEF)-like protein/PAS domain S-box-containing protein